MADDSHAEALTAHLIDAIRRHDPSAVSEILAAGSAQPEALNETDADRHFTPLLWAIHESQPEAARQLLAAGADPNLGPSLDRCPLAYSVSWREYDIARMLLRSPGLDLAEQGYAAAMEVALGGCTEGIGFLAENGLDLRADVPPNAGPTHHRNRATALMFGAFSVGAENPDLFRFLLEHGGIATATSLGGHTLPGRLCSKINEDPETLGVLLDSGADPSQLDGAGYGPLHYAAANNHHQSVEILLRARAPLAHRAADSSFPLLWAAANGGREVHGALLEDHDALLLAEVEKSVNQLPPIWSWTPSSTTWGALTIAPGDGSWHGEAWGESEEAVLRSLNWFHGTSRGHTSPSLVVQIVRPPKRPVLPAPWKKPGRVGELHRGQTCSLTYFAPYFPRGIPNKPPEEIRYRFLLAGQGGDNVQNPNHSEAISVEIKRIRSYEDGRINESDRVSCITDGRRWVLKSIDR